MPSKLARSILLAAAAATLAPGAATSARPAITTVTSGLVLDDVTVVDTRTGALRPHAAVVVDNGKIVRIAPAHSVRVRGTAKLLKAPGKYVVPGFLDMHAHPLNTSSPETSLPLMLANGITGFRQMAGSPALLAARKAGKPLLPTISPELLAMPGALLVGGASVTPADMVAEVRKQKAEGADFIKVIDVGPAAFLAAEDEARSQGLPIAGHLAPTLDVREAVRHGISSIEHLGPMISILLSCSSQEASIRDAIARAPAAPKISFEGSQETVKRRTANPMLLLPPPAFATFAKVIASYDDAKCRKLAADMAASSTWQVPTLVRIQAMDIGNDASFATNPDNQYVPATTRALWLEVGKDFEAKISPANKETLRQLFGLQLKLAKLFDAAGVKMMTGTDFGGQWLTPGFSLHDEFDLLARAGISPLHILQMTTLNGARFLARESTMGTVEAGKNADLVLLNGNPLTSVENLHRIFAVVRAGRLYRRSDLTQIEFEARATLAASAISSAPQVADIDSD